jgi:hypothetical protein
LRPHLLTFLPPNPPRFNHTELPSVIPKEWETAAKGSAAIKETYARFARAG